MGTGKILFGQAEGARIVIRFLLGGEDHVITAADPNATVLDYVRGSMQLPGTKEGCGTNDCGACTVVLGEVAVSIAGQILAEYHRDDIAQKTRQGVGLREVKPLITGKACDSGH